MPNSGDNTYGFDSFIRYTFDQDGNYYTGVSNWSNRDYDAQTGGADSSDSQRATGSYELVVTLADDRFGDNDTAPSAKNMGILTGSRTFNRLMMADSADWYRFQLEDRGTSEDRVIIRFEHRRGDIDIRLSDSGGRLLVVSQGTTDEERISLGGQALGTNHLTVYGYRGVHNPSSDDRFENNQSPSDASNLGTIANPRTFSDLIMANS